MAASITRRALHRARHAVTCTVHHTCHTLTHLNDSHGDVLAHIITMAIGH